jgi:hypothetical protein
MIDRSAVSQALAKAMAYKDVGKDAEAVLWVKRLIDLLGISEILTSQRADELIQLLEGDEEGN